MKKISKAKIILNILEHYSIHQFKDFINKKSL